MHNQSFTYSLTTEWSMIMKIRNQRGRNTDPWVSTPLPLSWKYLSNKALWIPGIPINIALCKRYRPKSMWKDERRKPLEEEDTRIVWSYTCNRDRDSLSSSLPTTSIHCCRTQNLSAHGAVVHSWWTHVPIDLLQSFQWNKRGRTNQWWERKGTLRYGCQCMIIVWSVRTES